MSQFTPEAWEVVDDRRVFGVNGLVCECWVPLTNDPKDNEWDSPEVLAAYEEAAANARLIAAAPKLLAALKDASKLIGANDAECLGFTALIKEAEGVGNV